MVVVTALLARRILRGVFVVTAVAITSACSEQATVEPVVAQIEVVTDAKSISMPLDVYELNAEETLAVSRAGDLLIDSCLRRFGATYDYAPEFDDLARLGGPVGRYERRYYLLDADSAALYGYAVPPDPERDALLGQAQRYRPAPQNNLLINGPRDPDAEPGTAYAPGLQPAPVRSTPTLSPEQSAALPIDDAGNPLPAGGCSWEADEVLTDGGRLTPEPELSWGISSLARGNASIDSRVEEATDAWSECMADKGFDFDSPQDAGNFPWTRRDTEDGVADAAEIATAVADVDCKLQVNYVGIFSSVERAYQEQLIEERAEELDGNLRDLREQLVIASQVLATAGQP